MLYECAQEARLRFLWRYPQDDLFLGIELRCHVREPLVAVGRAVGIGEHKMLVLGFFDGQGDGQFFTTRFHEVGIQGDHFEFGMELLLLDQKQGSAIGAAVIGQDDLKLRIVLRQPLGKVFFEVFFVVPTSNNHTHAFDLGGCAGRCGAFYFEEIAKQEDENEDQGQSNDDGEGDIGLFEC